jgi:hypothetical protein
MITSKSVLICQIRTVLTALCYYYSIADQGLENIRAENIRALTLNQRFAIVCAIMSFTDAIAASKKGKKSELDTVRYTG